MNRMARFAAIHFHSRVLIHEWSLLIGMALEADRVLRGSHPHLLRTFRAMRIVAISALDQPFVDPMMEGHIKFGLLRQVARVAKFWLGLDQQELRLRSMVWRMAGYAAHAVLSVDGMQRVHVLRSAGVALQAARIDIFRRGLFEKEQL